MQKQANLAVLNENLKLCAWTLWLTVQLLLLQAWNTTGDSYAVNPGDKPWISEMYGYSYACAAADVWHKVDFSAMLYPAYFTTSKPLHLLLYDVAALCAYISAALLMGCFHQTD